MRRDDSGHLVLVLRAKTHAGSGKAAEPETNECDLVGKPEAFRTGGRQSSNLLPPSQPINKRGLPDGVYKCSYRGDQSLNC